MCILYLMWGSLNFSSMQTTLGGHFQDDFGALQLRIEGLKLRYADAIQQLHREQEIATYIPNTVVLEQLALGVHLKCLKDSTCELFEVQLRNLTLADSLDFLFPGEGKLVVANLTRELSEQYNVAVKCYKDFFLSDTSTPCNPASLDKQCPPKPFPKGLLEQCHLAELTLFQLARTAHTLTTPSDVVESTPPTP